MRVYLLMSTLEGKNATWRQKIQKWRIVTVALMFYSAGKGLVLKMEDIFYTNYWTSWFFMIVEFQGVHSVRLLKRGKKELLYIIVHTWNRSLKVNLFEIKCFRQTVPRMNMFSSTDEITYFSQFAESLLQGGNYLCSDKPLQILPQA